MLKKLISFFLEEKQYGISIDAVERVYSAVEIISMPKLPSYMLGIINVGGKFLPVLNMHYFFDLSPYKISIQHYFMQIKIYSFQAIIISDAATEIIEYAEGDTNFEKMNSEKNNEYIKQIIPYKNDYILLLDIEKIIKHQDLKAIQQLINQCSVA